MTLLDARLEGLQEALDHLATAVDENLRAVLLGLTCDKNNPMSAKLTDTFALAHAARERCLMLVAREHPLANDLKYSMAALRVGHDYERIQELALALHRRVEQLRGTPVQELVQDMTGIMADILKMHEVVRSTWQRDRQDVTLPSVKPRVSTIAAGVYARISVIQNKIIEVIARGGGNAEMFVELVLACRHLKRICNTMEAIPDELHAFDRQ